MSNTSEQPKPKATDRRAMWPEVIAYVGRNYENEPGENTVDKLVEDMRERHRVGVERYGVPLTAHNGRDALIDAYQEQLDFAVYVRTWLDERGIETLTPEFAEPTHERPRDADGPRPLDDHEREMLLMFRASIEILLNLRGMLP